MTKFLRMALLAGLGVLSVASAAYAVVPDPTFSSCGTCLTVAPGGEYSFVVTVKDQFNSPINNSNVTIDFGSCVGVNLCSTIVDAGFVVAGSTISGHTGGSGQITFATHGGGTCTGTVKIYADGVQICSLGAAHSPDLNGDKLVTVTDTAIFSFDQLHGVLAADLNCDGFVTVTDTALLSASQFAHSSDPHCP